MLQKYTSIAQTSFPRSEIEASFLASLREAAADFQESESAERWSHLERHFRDRFGVDEETFQFLLDGSIEQRKVRRTIRKIEKFWPKRLSRVHSPSLRPRIVVVISEGQAVRSILLTDVCRKLAAWADLIILSPLDISAETDRLGEAATLLPIPKLRRTRLDYAVGYLGYLHTESPTTQQFALRLQENHQKALAEGEPLSNALRTWEVAAANQSLDDYLDLYRWSLRFFAHSHCLKEAATLLRSLRADIIFNTSVVNWSSRLWTRAAALNGLPIVSNVISWDNMSTKTLIDEFVGTFLIWSEEMDEDFSTSLPFVRDKSRVIVGSPQFEPIMEGQGLLPRHNFLGRFNLDPSKKLILYTTGSKTLFPREPECLDRLLTHWRDHLCDRASIMIRMHPKDRQGRYDEVMAKFPEVPFTVAGETVSEDEEWVPSSADIALLVNQLRHCDLIINVASTMTIEGFTIDKPSINIGFTMGPSVSARYPMDDYYRSRHYRDVVESGAARLVTSFEDLFEAIVTALNEQEVDKIAQQKILKRKCLYTSDSSRRIDDFLRAYTLSRSSRAQRLVRWIQWMGARSVKRLVAAYRLRRLPRLAQSR